MYTKRVSREVQMMRHAYVASLRGTCRRRRTGAVITDRYGIILGTGYNGVATGVTHCLDVPCPGAEAESGKDLDKCEAIHAECNALLHCSDIRLAYAIYCTTGPCIPCMKMMSATNIRRLYYCEKYPHHETAETYWTHVLRRRIIPITVK